MKAARLLVIAAALAPALGQPSAAAPASAARPSVERIAPRVTVAGIRVGRMKPAAAEEKVRERLSRPLALRAGNLRLRVDLSEFRFRAYVKAAIAKARKAPEGARIRVATAVDGAAVRSFVRTFARRFHRDAIDSQVVLRGLDPFVTKGERGRDLVRRAAVRKIVFSLVRNQRRPLNLAARRIPQRISRATFGPVIVIRRESNELRLYDGMRPWRTFGVGTGQTRYPTPLGRFQIVVKWRNPWWYPPASDWAKGLKPVPPGPGNPLGTRWMGLSAPSVGIHGTPDDASIGYSVSHGCIRMHIPDAEWLFEQVSIGTPVFIVSA